MISRLHFTVNILLVISLICSAASADVINNKAGGKKPVVITSDSLTANSGDNTAVFEGSVVAKTDDMTMLSDKMTVYYDNTGKKISRIHAAGSVKVYNSEKVIFSKEALYVSDEEKIVFSGDPKAVEGKNVLTGKQITYYLKSNRAVVEGSRIILQENQGQK
ncbi:MAG: hypothetical protein OEU95_00165 [Nitrospirota bacterium]|nr:hypothetical protein [Nitrospirota bacterium]